MIKSAITGRACCNKVIIWCKMWAATWWIVHPLQSLLSSNSTSWIIIWWLIKRHINNLIHMWALLQISYRITTKICINLQISTCWSTINKSRKLICFKWVMILASHFRNLFYLTNLMRTFRHLTAIKYSR